MLEKKHIVEPENLGLWAAAAFFLALLALIMSFVNLYRTNEMMTLTQLEILMLNKKMGVGMAAPAAPAAPAQQEMK